MSQHSDQANLTASSESSVQVGSTGIVSTLKGRPWFHLHISTYVVVSIVVVVVCLLNIPGNWRGYGQFGRGSAYSLDLCIEHGWPLTYLRRAVLADDPNSVTGQRDASIWWWFDSRPILFDWSSAVIDSMIAGATCVAVGVA